VFGHAFTIKQRIHDKERVARNWAVRPFMLTFVEINGFAQ
jgi:hypothetical protein